jgi:hypothetical protein
MARLRYTLMAERSALIGTSERFRPGVPSTGGIASSSGTSWVTSLRLAPVRMTASGMPAASVISIVDRGSDQWVDWVPVRLRYVAMYVSGAFQRMQMSLVVSDVGSSR